jgi:hypothetical protein
LRSGQAKSSQDPHLNQYLGAAACAYPKLVGRAKQARLAWAKRTLISKITKAKRTGGMAQAIECLPSKYEALSSNLSIKK